MLEPDTAGTMSVMNGAAIPSLGSVELHAADIDRSHASTCWSRPPGGTTASK